MVEAGACRGQLLQPRRVGRRYVVRVPHPFARQMLECAITPVFMVAGADLWSATRGRPRVAFARQVAMYLAHVACGLNLTEVGHLFSRDRTTVAHACGLIEDLRDDGAFDRCLDLLEGVLRRLASAPWRQGS